MQGLIVHHGHFYESTGLYGPTDGTHITGPSTVRRVAIATGEIVQNAVLEDQLFAEGMTIWGNQLVMLTWREQVRLQMGLRIPNRWRLFILILLHQEALPLCISHLCFHTHTHKHTRLFYLWMPKR